MADATVLFWWKGADDGFSGKNMSMFPFQNGRPLSSRKCLKGGRVGVVRVRPNKGWKLDGLLPFVVGGWHG